MKKTFELLNIEETKDSEKIKRAYRAQLVKVHPEEDPEGFKQLRSAYEQALNWANQTEEDLTADQTAEQTAADLWISKVEAVYASFSKRLSLPEWTALFEDDLCVGLDTFYEAREKLIVFLMDHFRLPFEVWQLIDQCFHIVDDKADLYERFPRNFLNYALDSIDHPWLLDYSLFEGEDDGDYDGYIAKYHQLKASLDEGKELPEELLSDMRSGGVYHPYTDVEEARYLIRTERLEEGFKRLTALRKRHPQDAYILYYLGQVKWKMEDYEGAFQAFSTLVEENPKHFSALLGMGDYYLKKGEFEKAKDLFLELLDMDNQNQALREKVQQANNALIKRFEALIAAETAAGEDKIELGWCYLQNESYEKTLDLLESMTTEEREQLYHYNNLKGRAYLCLNQHKEALPCVLGWIEDIKALGEEDDEETQKRKQRLGYAHFAAATCYAALAKGPEEEESAAKALEYLDLAVKLEHNPKQSLSYRHYKANLLLKLKQYHESIQMCDGILEEQKDYFAACLTRQECYFALEHYQNVVDDYHRCVEIYPYHPKPYILAARTFWLYRSCEAGMRVMELSKENQVASDELVLHESRFLHETAQTDEEIEKALEICSVLLSRDREETDLEAFGDVYHQCAICLSDLKRYDEALSMIEKAILIDAEEDKYYFVKANMLSATGHTDEALEIYTELDRKIPENGNILFRIASLYKKTDRETDAEDYFKKALAANPDHRTANFELMCIYKKRLEQEQKKELFNKAIEYATRQLDALATAYYYIERGLIYLDENRFEEALADFMKASELEPENMYAMNNAGMVFRNQERYEEAIPYFKKASAYAEENKSLLPYGNLGKCYESLGKYEEAVACYLENLRMFPEEPSAYKDLAEVFNRMGRFSEALQHYQMVMDVPRANKKYFLLQMGHSYRYQEDWTKAEAQYKKVIEEYPDYAHGYKRLAELYIYNLGAPKKGIKYLKAAMKDLPKEYASDYEQFAYELGVAYFLQGKKRTAAAWLKTALEIYEKALGIETYIAFTSRRQARLYNLGQIYFYLDDKEKARQYLSMMEDCAKCHSCSYPQCYERYIGRGMILEMDGKPSEAKVQYQKALAIDSYNQEAILRLKVLG